MSLGSSSGFWELAVRADNIFNTRYYTEFFPTQLGPQLANGTCNQCHLGAIGALRRVVGSNDVRV